MRFYVLANPKLKDSPFATDFLDVDPVNRGDAPRCEVCGRFIGMLPWLPPFRAELEAWGPAFGDIAFGPGDGILISDRFKRMWEQSKLTGFNIGQPVELVKVKKHKRIDASVPAYHFAVGRRSRAAIDVIRSELERTETDEPVCSECRLGGVIKRAKRLLLEEATWSGEDVFTARGLPGTYITTERFKDFCNEHQIKNAVLIEVEKYSFDFCS